MTITTAEVLGFMNLLLLKQGGFFFTVLNNSVFSDIEMQFVFIPHRTM